VLDRLTARDPDLAAIERRAGTLPWRTRPTGFPGLLQAIIGQQISNQAAAAIRRRVRTRPGTLAPAGLGGLSDARIVEESVVSILSRSVVSISQNRLW